MELIEDESQWTSAAAIYLVKIGYEEAALREKVKTAGGAWNAEKKVWLVRGYAVRRLELEDRVVGWVDLE